MARLFLMQNSIMHGKQSEIYHDGTGIFTGLDSPVKVARYHSLAIIEKTLPDCLEVIAKTQRWRNNGCKT